MWPHEMCVCVRVCEREGGRTKWCLASGEKQCCIHSETLFTFVSLHETNTTATTTTTTTATANGTNPSAMLLSQSYRKAPNTYIKNKGKHFERKPFREYGNFKKWSWVYSFGMKWKEGSSKSSIFYIADDQLKSTACFMDLGKQNLLMVVQF